MDADPYKHRILFRMALILLDFENWSSWNWQRVYESLSSYWISAVICNTPHREQTVTGPIAFQFIQVKVIGIIWLHRENLPSIDGITLETTSRATRASGEIGKA